MFNTFEIKVFNFLNEQYLKSVLNRSLKLLNS